MVRVGFDFYEDYRLIVEGLEQRLDHVLLGREEEARCLHEEEYRDKKRRKRLKKSD